MSGCPKADMHNCIRCACLADCRDVPVVAIDREVKRALVVLAIVVLAIACLCVTP
jgi:hypothetical protein